VIKKEWHCDGCNLDFESAIDLCKRCGQPATRAFRTPPGIGNGSAKRIDALLERNFAKRGISNYTNSGGKPQINWANQPKAFPDGDWRAGGWGKEHLSAINSTFGANFSPPALSGPQTISTNVAPDNPKAQKEGWARFVDTEVINKEGD
jgi:hypothetical protein